MVKTCTRCGAEKCLSEFGKNVSRKDGLTFYCLACTRAAGRGYWHGANIRVCLVKSKRCPECYKDLPIACYAKNAKKTDGLQTSCKACCSRRTHKIRQTARSRLWAIKLASGCVDCKDPTVPPWRLQFDHLPGTEKLFNVGDQGHSWSRVQAEIAKCEVVCLPCHVKRTVARKLAARDARNASPSEQRPSEATPCPSSDEQPAWERRLIQRVAELAGG